MLGDDAGQASKRVMDAVVFDLDGTLWDTSASCAIGWNRVLDRHRIPFRPITEHDVRAVTGKPHDECIREVFAGLNEAHIVTLAAETELEDNRVVAELGGELFGDVEAGLRRLCARYPLFIVSNCQAGYIETFFQWSGLGGCFRDFECRGNTGLSKTQNLRVLIDRNRLQHPVFVGDTPGDQTAARDCGVPFLHAAYGFGECADAEHRFPSFSALTAHLLNQPPAPATARLT
jgi:phosphoglycolate phosphatase